MNKLAIAMRMLFLTAAVILTSAMVYDQTPYGVGMRPGEHGTKLYGFYDYINGWYSTAVIVSMLFLFAFTGVLMPRPKRRGRP